MPTDPISGAQCTLRTGDYVAEIAAIGASLRTLRYRGRDVVVPFDADAIRPAMRGAILAPWPNRTADGRYRFGEVEHRLPVNEIETNTATHGLVAWQRFEAVGRTSGSVSLRSWIEPQPGYPWRVMLDVEYRLGSDGLAIVVCATNESATPAPFGIGIHPYLVAGDLQACAVDDWSLEVPATEVLFTDARMLPTEIVPLGSEEASGFDFRSTRRIGAAVLNHAFTGLRRGEDGRARVRVTDPSGGGAEISWDAASEWVQLYTSDEATGPERRHAIAVEPQSCAPDALNSGRGLLTLLPGGSARFGWWIRALDAPEPSHQRDG
ncbi:aldose 1-epimerase family protein [Agromyces sp. SYSU T00194]|uniref:aldose 1-epimerase family protein n=1 Tax=Agromyces chitinivorans TaxID=3158560 RepID=UPI0033981B9B